jgi:glyoxylase-like metal-dependent hydrolase (beta-lactamase superfamily II)/8-oxo-dGTP pyrophosphatase MutT (NUDIX family)
VSALQSAASVLLVDGPQVYLVSRSPALRFMGGFVAFPGGKAGTDDETLAVALGTTPAHVCAVRETFEETGVLLVDPAPTGDLSELRRALLAAEVSFAEVLGRLGARPSAISPAGRLVTPPFAPVRFDTTFYVGMLPAGQRPEIWRGELVAGHWYTVARALEAWDRGELALSPPTVSILEFLRCLAPDEWAGGLSSALLEVHSMPLPPIWFSPGVRMLPLDCLSIPPTRYTNAYVVGAGPRYLIDPGPAQAAEQEVLLDSIGGEQIDAIILTHHHRDHIGAAERCRRALNAPILAHPETARLVPFGIDRHINEGDVIDLGQAPHGRGRWAMQALHTPGHAPGHLAFLQKDYGLLLAADLVSPLSSIIIDPTDGDLALYIQSLERVRRLSFRLLLPSHGPPTMKGHQLIEQAIKHRQTREEQLLAALANGPRTVQELALEMYRGSPPETLRLAERQIESGLIKLRREGRL